MTYLTLGGISLRSSGFLCLDSDDSGHDFPGIYCMKNREAFTQKRDFLFGFSSKNTFARYLTQRCFCWLHVWIYAWFSELYRKKCSMKALYLEKMQFIGIILSEHYHWRIKESRSESSTLAAFAVWVSVPGESWYPEEAEPGSRIAVSQWDCYVSIRKQSLLSVTASNQSRSAAIPSGLGFHGNKFTFSTCPPFILVL